MFLYLSFFKESKKRKLDRQLQKKEGVVFYRKPLVSKMEAAHRPSDENLNLTTQTIDSSAVMTNLIGMNFSRDMKMIVNDIF